jgi:hypothetical protein
MIQIFAPDDPLVLNGTYDVYGFKPRERRAYEKKRAAARRNLMSDPLRAPLTALVIEMRHRGVYPTDKYGVAWVDRIAALLREPPDLTPPAPEPPR